MENSTNTYVVRKGDTLERIACDHGTSVDMLVRYNHIKDPDRITVGQVVKFEPMISLQVLDRLYQPIPGMQLSLFVSGRHHSDVTTCDDGRVKNIVLPSFSDVLHVCVYKLSGERKEVARIKPSGIPKEVQLVSPKVKAAAVAARTHGGIAQPVGVSHGTQLTATRSVTRTPVIQVERQSVYGKEKSGAHWVSRFPTSTSLDDLAEPFRSKAKCFVKALRDCGTRVRINATFRPVERSYMMFYSAAIARGEIDPVRVPEWPGINIDWAHLNAQGLPDRAAARAAARAMMVGLGVGRNPVGEPGRSNHNKRKAIDISVSGYSGKIVVGGDGESFTLHSWQDVRKLGESYDVYWYGAGDRPHWSWNGR